jgi:uncharacterized protein
MRRCNITDPQLLCVQVMLLAIKREKIKGCAKRMLKLKLNLLPGKYALCRLDPDGPIPYWALLGDDFVSLTRTSNELSIVCLQENVPEDVKADRDWHCLRVLGSFDFSVAGVHVALAVPLSQAEISVLTIATYETDHILIKEDHLEQAMRVLEAAGHQVNR